VTTVCSGFPLRGDSQHTKHRRTYSTYQGRPQCSYSTPTIAKWMVGTTLDAKPSDFDYSASGGIPPYGDYGLFMVYNSLHSYDPWALFEVRLATKSIGVLGYDGLFAGKYYITDRSSELRSNGLTLKLI
jgi:hypothetical protein